MDRLDIFLHGSGAPHEIVFQLDRPATPENDYALIYFATNSFDLPLSTGTYTDAIRAPNNALEGLPGLSVFFSTRGCNRLTGEFTIHTLELQTGPAGEYELVAFDATFEQHCEGREPALRGRVTFNATPVPEPSSLALLVPAIGGLLGCGAYRRRRMASRGE